MGSLIMYTGKECVHCNEMKPLVARLEKELVGIKVKKLEVWHNAANAAKLKKADTIDCGGVPFFFNENTKKAICGAMSYARLKKWASGE